MTFDHQIDFDPATRGSAATTLKTERQVIVRKLLVAQAFATVPDQQQRNSVLGSTPTSNHDIRRTHVCGEYTAGKCWRRPCVHRDR